MKQIKLGAKSWDEACKSTELAALRQQLATNKQTGRQADRQTNRQTEIQMQIHMSQTHIQMQIQMLSMSFVCLRGPTSPE